MNGNGKLLGQSERVTKNIFQYITLQLKSNWYSISLAGFDSNPITTTTNQLINIYSDTERQTVRLTDRQTNGQTD